MNCTRPAEAKAPPPGEWAVFHERPFSKRIDRAFGWAAIATAALVASAGLVGAAVALSRGNASAAVGWVCLSLAIAPVIALPVYGLGMAIGGLYRLTRPKTYVVDWHEPETYRQQISPALIFFGFLIAEIVLFGIATRFG